jgi:membrane protein DedA with SNARE-associated domain
VIDQLLRTLASLPPELIYAFIGLGAAVENFVPPIPADTFVLLGAFLAARGRADPWVVFFVTWIMNVGSAVVVYLLAHRFGKTFFTEHHLGKLVLNERQMSHIDQFYRRWGTPAIFVSRFLPAFRAMVPVFAGVTHVRFWRVFIPLAAASALWYGALVYLGAMAGKNWQAIISFFSRASSVLLGVALLLLVAFAYWWVKSRRHPRQH